MLHNPNIYGFLFFTSVSIAMATFKFLSTNSNISASRYNGLSLYCLLSSLNVCGIFLILKFCFVSRCHDFYCRKSGLWYVPAKVI